MRPPLRPLLVLILALTSWNCGGNPAVDRAAELAAAVAAAEADPVYRQRAREFQLLFQGGQHRAALEQAKLALEAAPVLRDPYVWVSRLCTELGSNQEAIRLFRETSERHPDLALPWYYKGFNEYHMSLFGEALKSFERASELDPEDPQSWFRQGMVHYVQSDFDAAWETLSRSYEIDPSSELTVSNLFDVLRIRGDDDRALEIVEGALVRTPDSAELLYRLGLLQVQRGEEQAAEETLRRAIQLQPKLRDPHEHLARLLAQSGRDSEAELERDISERLNDYEKTRKTLEARKVDAKDGAIALLLAEVELSAGNPQAAVRWFQQVQQYGGLEPRRTLGHAEALYRLGQVEVADQLVRDLSSAGPRFGLAQVARELQMKRPVEARVSLERAIERAPFEREFIRRAADYAYELGDLEWYGELLHLAVSAKTLSTAPDSEVRRD